MDNETKWLIPRPLAFRVPADLDAEDAVGWLTTELLARGFRVGLYSPSEEEADGVAGVYEITRSMN